MDLFGGCGGITLGFVTAGFELVASVESDKWAAASHGANFAAFSRGNPLDAHLKARDITKETPGSIFKDLGISGHVEEQVDVLVGGPPCQAFARVGRAKLRHEAHRRDATDADIAFLTDGRVNLWQRYLHYVRKTKPLAPLYPLYERANSDLPKDAGVLLSAYCGAFYIDRATYCSEMIQDSLRFTTWEDFSADLRRLKITHVIAPSVLATGGPAPGLGGGVSALTREGQFRLIRQLLADHSSMLQTASDQGLYEIDPAWLRGREVVGSP